MARPAPNTIGHLDIGGHRVVYRLSGQGPALVALYPHRRPELDPRPPVLAHRWRVFQIDPLGFGASDRPWGYPADRFHEQVLAMLDRHDVERFAVWGYSRGGAMAAAVARSTDRVNALVCGGFPLIHHEITEGYIRRLDREQRTSLLSRDLWRAFQSVDWYDALVSMSFPKLVYFGDQDRHFTPRRRREIERHRSLASTSSVSAAWTTPPATDPRWSGASRSG